MIMAIETHSLGKRYRKKVALQNCTLRIPAGRVVALVGPNGAGKTTLLRLLVGLARPTEGSARVLDISPDAEPKRLLSHIGFVAQNHPLYPGFTVEEMLHLSRSLNRQWDQTKALARLNQLRIPLNARVGTLSGGQRAQVALVLALAKIPDILILDEPVASLDPLARQEFLRTLMDEVAQRHFTVILSSHILSDLERVCDYVVVLASSQVQVNEDVDTLLQTHCRLLGPRSKAEMISTQNAIIQADFSEKQASLLVRLTGPILDPAWQREAVHLEEIILAYLSRSSEQQVQSATLPFHHQEVQA